jgi:hypothetical protein
MDDQELMIMDVDMGDDIDLQPCMLTTLMVGIIGTLYLLVSGDISPEF